LLRDANFGKPVFIRARCRLSMRIIFGFGFVLLNKTILFHGKEDFSRMMGACAGKNNDGQTKNV